MSFTDAKVMAAKAKRSNEQAVTAARAAITAAINQASISGKTKVDSYDLSGLPSAPRQQIISDLIEAGYSVTAHAAYDQRDSDYIIIDWGHA